MISIYDEKSWQEGKQKLRGRARGINADALHSVQAIVQAVRERGDEALFGYTKAFDGAQVDERNLRVQAQEIEAAYDKVDKSLLVSMRRCMENIRAFHEQQRYASWMDIKPGVMVGQIVRPLACVGVYVPGGRAAYPSSVLMNVVPAKVAGVKTICMATPPQKDGSIAPLTLVAAKEAGVDIIYRMGGAQAIAALAYGTKSVMRVDKITGPGNVYVALAKREVFGQCGIDMIAGPSEVCIVADKSAPAAYIAADMLSQAEHDPDAAAWLVTDSPALAQEVLPELEKQLSALPRADIARSALRSQGAVITAPSIEEALRIANDIAPEHLELMTEDSTRYLGLVENAGAVFLGVPEPLGDYFAGPNHVLPTGGAARFFSPLGVEDFIKRSSVIQYAPAALADAARDIMAFAEAEGLHAHANAIAVRIKK